VENAQQVGDEQNQKDGSQPDARTTSRTPTAVAVVSATAAKNQQQNYNQYQHVILPFFPSMFPYKVARRASLSGCHRRLQIRSSTKLAKLFRAKKTAVDFTCTHARRIGVATTHSSAC
jgi:hypothetical protein